MKAVDRLIDGEFETVAEEAGLSRHEWQVVSRLSIGAERAESADETLAPFCAPGQSVEELLRPLRKQGLVEERSDEVRLTEQGEGTARQVEEQAVARIDGRIGDGLSGEDRETLLRLLEQVAKNLGWQPL